MPSMLEMLEDEAIIGGGGNIVSTTESGDFPNNLKTWTRRIVSDYARYRIDLNKAIASIAEKNNLNNEQIQRLVEEVNTQVYLIEYNRMKNSTIRNVDFDIANLQKIKDMTDNNIKANIKTPDDPETKGEEAKLDKKASWEANDNGGDSLNFLNYSGYSTIGLSEDKKITKRALLERELIAKLSSMDNEISKLASNLNEDVAIMAGALIKYARLNRDHQEIFEKTAKESDMLKTTQMLVKKAFVDNVNFMKEVKELPESFPSDLKLVDCFDKEAKLSLGEHSLIKIATENSSNKEIPTVVVDKRTFKDYQSLVNLATKIQSQQEDLIKKEQEKNKIEKILQP